MPQRLTCPGCQSPLMLDDRYLGQDVQCGRCQRVFKAEAPQDLPLLEVLPVEPLPEVPLEPVRERPRARREEDEDEPRPRSRKREREREREPERPPPPYNLLVGAAVLVLAVLVAGGTAFIYILWRAAHGG